MTVVRPFKPSSITLNEAPSSPCMTPVQRTSGGKRLPVPGSKPQVFESPKAKITGIVFFPCPFVRANTGSLTFAFQPPKGDLPSKDNHPAICRKIHRRHGSGCATRPRIAEGAADLDCSAPSRHVLSKYLLSTGRRGVGAGGMGEPPAPSFDSAVLALGQLPVVPAAEIRFGRSATSSSG